MRLLGLVVLILMLFAGTVQATEIVVTNLNDDGAGSLRDAVSQANAMPDADDITFDFSALPGEGQRTINLTSDGLLISRNVRIMGPGPKDLVVQRATDEGTPRFRIFSVLSGDRTVLISGMTIRNGMGNPLTGGGALSTGAGNKVRLHDAVVENNTADAGEGRGGGAISNAGQLSITSSVFSNNSVKIVSGNSPTGGGAIFNTGQMTIDKSVFSDNSASEAVILSQGDGGAILNSRDATLKVTNSSFDGNTASGFGGAILNDIDATMSLSNSTVGNNSALQGGGGVMTFGTIEQLNSNIISGNIVDPDVGMFSDLGRGIADGTINSGTDNIIGNSDGHGLDPATNQFGVDPKLGPLQDNGGPTPSRQPDPADSPAKDKGDDRLGLRFDQRGFFRTVDGGTDVGSFETGNVVFLPEDLTPRLWRISPNWLDGNVPGDGDDVWIVGGATADLTGAGPIDIESLNVGVSGDVGTVRGGVVGFDVTLSIGTFDVGSGYGIESPINSGDGEVTLDGVALSIETFNVGSAEVTGVAILAGGDGRVTITSDAGSDSTLSVAGDAAIGTATAFVSDADARGRGSLRFTGMSASFGALFLAESFAVDGGYATTSSTVAITADQNVTTGSLSVASAFSGPDAETLVEEALVEIIADEFIINGPATIGMAQGSGPTISPPSAEVDVVDYSVAAARHTIDGRFSVGGISMSTSGPPGTRVATARVGSIGVAIEVDFLTVGSGLAVAPVFATGPSNNTIDDVSVTITESDTEVAGSASVGTLFLSDGASGVAVLSKLNVIGGLFRVTNTPSFLTSMRIGTIDAFTPAGLAQTNAVVRFDGVVVDLSSSLEIANTNSAGADPDSFAHGTLELVNSQMTVGVDVILAQTGGVAPIDSAIATMLLNPSFVSIGGDLLLGAGAILDITVEGLTRPALGSAGEYGAIDAAGAMLDGQLMLDFDFPAVAEGDMFELIRLDAGGAFVGDFDSFSAGGLPVGLGIQTLFAGDSFFAEVVAVQPPMLPGDTNGDALVNIDDLNNVRNNFGATGVDDGTLPGDAFPFDGLVDIDDLNAVRNNFGTGAGPVPEPAGFALALLSASMALIARRRRKGWHESHGISRLAAGRAPPSGGRARVFETVRYSPMMAW